MNWDKKTTTPEGGMEKLAEAINYFQTEIFKLSTRVSSEVLKTVCGKELTAEPLIRYFKKKYFA